MPFSQKVRLETLVLFYWICCVCSWCMRGAGLPKWINTITSSRWLRHLVPLPVIVLMLYWLLLSRKLNACSPAFTDTHTHTSSFITHLHHSHTLPSAKSPQSIFHGALEWLCHELIGHAFNPFELEGWRGTLGGGIGSGLDINTEGQNNQCRAAVCLWASHRASWSTQRGWMKLNTLIDMLSVSRITCLTGLKQLCQSELGLTITSQQIKRLVSRKSPGCLDGALQNKSAAKGRWWFFFLPVN